MNVNGIWILILGILALPGAAVITRWMSPIGKKNIGLVAGVFGGILAIALLEVISGGINGITPLVAGVDAFSAAVVSFFTVSAASAAVGLLVNWALHSLQSRNGAEEAFAE